MYIAVRFAKNGEAPCGGWPIVISQQNSDILPSGYDQFMTNEEIQALCASLSTTPEYIAWNLSQKDERMANIRQRRNDALVSSDYMDFPSYRKNISYTDFIKMLVYRQNLRNLFENYQDPDTLVFPEMNTSEVQLRSWMSAQDEEVIVDLLWQAYHWWEYDLISGAAFSAINMKAVIQQKPKSLAIVNWVTNHWNDYSIKKANLLAGQIVDIDASISGGLPYSVFEAISE